MLTGGVENDNVIEFLFYHLEQIKRFKSLNQPTISSEARGLKPLGERTSLNEVRGHRAFGSPATSSEARSSKRSRSIYHLERSERLKGFGQITT